MEYRINQDWIEAGDGSNYPDYVIEKRDGPLAAWEEVTRFMTLSGAEKWCKERDIRG